MRTITLEEHFVSRAFLNITGHQFGAQRVGSFSSAEIVNLGELRLQDMDDSGIDVQVISHVEPTLDQIPINQQIEIAKGANNEAAHAIAAHPDRFAAFAALPVADTDAAVDEFQRAVGDLGFKGALINGRAAGRFLDHPSLFPVLQRAALLGVPLYLHPGLPTEVLRREYYADLSPDVSFALSGPAWGWHAETGLHVLRMILAGIFDRLPQLQIIIGHMGEMIPFMLDRTDTLLTPLARRDGLQRSIAETFRSNFWVTTSGLFSPPPFQLLQQTIGIDRILFSVDYPFNKNSEGRAFLNALPISSGDKAKISHLNAEKLLKIPAAH